MVTPFTECTEQVICDQTSVAWRLKTNEMYRMTVLYGGNCMIQRKVYEWMERFQNRVDKCWCMFWAANDCVLKAQIKKHTWYNQRISNDKLHLKWVSFMAKRCAQKKTLYSYEPGNLWTTGPNALKSKGITQINEVPNYCVIKIAFNFFIHICITTLFLLTLNDNSTS